MLRMGQLKLFQVIKKLSMVFSGIFPTQSEDFEDLRSALEKLQLNDASLTYEPETSKALGFGFRRVPWFIAYGDCSRALGSRVRH